MSGFGRLLRERRQEQGLTLTALAGELGVTKSYVSMLESGRRQPADDQFDVLAQTLESTDHQWYIGKMDPADKAERAKAAAEFKARYEKK